MHRIIQIDDAEFFVVDTDMSKNYSDVSKMFAFYSNIQIPSSPVILDVGANIGIYSLSYASLFKNSKIFSFEPVNTIYQDLNNNLNLNPILKKRIQTFNFGFSDVCKNLTLSIPTQEQHKRFGKDINNGLFSIHGKGGEKVNGKFFTLDSYMLEKSSPDSVDFIKIDVEGHEFEVLKGGEYTINKFKPTIIFEFNELTRKLSKNTNQDFLDFFHKYDYSLFGVQYGWKEKLVSLNNFSDVYQISDVVAIFDKKISH